MTPVERRVALFLFVACLPAGGAFLLLGLVDADLAAVVPAVVLAGVPAAWLLRPPLASGTQTQRGIASALLAFATVGLVAFVAEGLANDVRYIVRQGEGLTLEVLAPVMILVLGGGALFPVWRAVARAELPMLLSLLGPLVLLAAIPATSGMIVGVGIAIQLVAFWAVTLQELGPDGGRKAAIWTAGALFLAFLATAAAQGTLLPRPRIHVGGGSAEGMFLAVVTLALLGVPLALVWLARRRSAVLTGPSGAS